MNSASARDAAAGIAAAMTPLTVRAWIAAVAAERARRAPPADFPELPDIPAARYRDADFFALERDRCWRRTWLYAGHLDQLPEPGSYFVWPHGSAPVLVIRGDDGEVRAFYNTCRHRGAPLARHATGRAGATLVCGYHGWSYDRAGRLRGVTEQRDWRGLDPACRGLLPLRCERFGNWLFVNEDADAEPLAAFLAPVARFMCHLPLDGLRLVNRRAFEVRCHYRLLIDNFLEAYHFRLLHAKTTDRIFDNQGTSIHLWRNGHSVMLSPNRRDDWVDPGTIGMPEMAGATSIERDHNPSYCIFPNLIVPIAVTGMPCVAIWPQTVATSAMEVLWFAPDWGDGPRDPLWEQRIANFDRIVDEDIQFAEPMQATITSPGFTGVPLSYQERRIYHWNEAIDRCIGIAQVPPALRMAPRLAALVE
ncbi:MAG: aromatic ring-hydroxylating dioxygenase subunit alpha [Gammaproteobacteria bacterium]